jgi:WD40 repeat protein
LDAAKNQSVWVKSEAQGSVVALSADGRWAVSEVGTSDKGGTLQVWEIATGKKVSQMAHSLPVRAIAFDPTGQRLAMSETCPTSGSCAATIRVWQAATGQEIVRSRGTASALAFTLDGKRLVVAGDDQVARVLLVEHKDLMAAACARLPRDFTREELDRFIGAEPYHHACSNLPLPKP